ncbi:MAG: HAD family hydrolase [Candidatus Aenigmarchaeota archaeon]|nr:HAD family hydrolase [Candidatus Aenigmarchaeota archaeon]
MKAVIFDYDGVIADSFSVVHALNNKIMRHFGRKEYALDDFRRVSMDWKATYRSLGMTEEQIEESARMFYHDIALLQHEVQVFRGMEKVLAELHTRCRIGIVTNNLRSIIETKLRNEKILAFIHEIVDGHEGKLKPDPTSVTMCMNKLGVRPTETCLVGDTFDDILAGRRAGVAKVIAVSYGYHSLEQLKGADVVVHSPAEILAALAA